MSLDCPICGKAFKNGAGLAGHLRMIHNKEGNDVEGYEEALAGARGEKKIDRIRELYDKLKVLRVRRTEAEADSANSQGLFHRFFQDENQQLEKKILTAYLGEEKLLEQELTRLVDEVNKETEDKLPKQDNAKKPADFLPFLGK